MGDTVKDVMRPEPALKLCVKFLQKGEIQPNGERHPYLLWNAPVSSGQLALGQRLKKGKDGKLRWKRIQISSTNTTAEVKKQKLTRR